MSRPGVEQPLPPETGSGSDVIGAGPVPEPAPGSASVEGETPDRRGKVALRPKHMRNPKSVALYQASAKRKATEQDRLKKRDATAKRKAKLFFTMLASETAERMQDAGK